LEAEYTLPDLELGLSKSQTLWVNENWKSLRAFWLVVDFIHVSREIMAPGMKVGTPNYALGNGLLKELLL
jgi:hypothetical protein